MRVASLSASVRALWQRPIARVAAAKVISDVATRSSLLVVVVLILREGGADALGAWSQLQVIVALLAPFAVVGLAQAAVPHLAPSAWDRQVRARLRQMFAVGVAASLALALAFVVCAAWINDLVLHWEDGDRLFRVGGALVGVTGLEALALALLQARSRFGHYIAVQAGSTMVTIVAAVIVLPGDGGVVAFCMLLTALRAAVVAVAWLLLASGMNHDSGIEPPGVVVLARFGLGVSSAEIGAWGVLLADRLVYGHFGTASGLGAYSAVYTATSFVAILGASVFLPAFPALARAWTSGRELELRRVVADIHRHLVVIVVPAAALVLVSTRPVLALIGRGDVDPGAGVVALVVLAVGVSQWNAPARFVLIAVEGGSAVRPGWLAGFAVAVASAFALVPPFGLVGAATSTALSFGTVDVLFALRATRWAALGRTYAWAMTLRAVVAATLGAIAFEAVRVPLRESLWTLGLAAAAFAIVYVGSIGAVQSLSRTRRQPA